jgi:pyridoxamine 5'-phosphate oxidase
MPGKDPELSLERLRREYARAALDESSVRPDPVEQFAHWLDEARQAGLLDPHAMTLATADAAGRPDARIVLLKAFGPEGFVFFTDYRSRKGGELGENPWVALLFYWGDLERQVRLVGPVTKVAREMSEAYFGTRPLGSQLGAWASHQSAVLRGGRPELEERLREVTTRFTGGPVPLPPHWGGYCVRPEEFEFWQGRENRLHDRIRYGRRRTADWIIERLSP